MRRTGENLAAAIARLQRHDPRSYARLVEITRQLPEHTVLNVEIARSDLDDVTVALRELHGNGEKVVPARQMSDGTLRMLAVATALLSGGQGLALDPSAAGTDAVRLCLVLEELENGLHPSQAARVLDLVKSTSRQRGFQVVLTTHSPALLNALPGEDHPGVLVCERDAETGASTLGRLDALPGYLAMMARNRLGDAVADGRLATARHPSDGGTSLGELLGIA